MLFKVRATPMVRVTVWLQLLLVILILRQSVAVFDQCSKLQEEISRLERDIVRITDLKHKNELRAGNCDEHLRKQVLISQATSKKLNKSEAVNNDLKKQLEVKEVLKSINEKQTELQTTIDGRTKTVDRMNHQLFEKQTQLQTSIDGLTKTVETLLCETTKNVCRSLLDAAKSGDVDSARRLVKCDSNDNCTDDDEYRNTPLTYAARYGHVEVVRVLLEGGANVDRATAYRSTALHYASSFGHLDVCRLLLDRGAKVDRLNRSQYTPLLNAASNGHLSVVKLLVERGADVSAENDRGQTASDVARLYKKKDVADWLDSVRRG